MATGVSIRVEWGRLLVVHQGQRQPGLQQGYKMTPQEFKSWRQERGLSQGKLARALGVRSLTVARWEWGMHRLPALLPLALEGLEARLVKGGEGSID